LFPDKNIDTLREKAKRLGIKREIVEPSMTVFGVVTMSQAGGNGRAVYG
jgi:hypothetical protein